MFRKSLLCASLLASFASTGCDSSQEQEADFRDGLPTREMVTVKAPGPQAQKRRTAPGAMEEHKMSEFYLLTQGAAETINQGPEAVLDLIDGITQYVPTSISGGTAVWGPYTDASHLNAWKLTVIQEGEHAYRFRLEGKDKKAADSAFKVILSGAHTLSTDGQGNRLRNFGSGFFTLDWDAAQSLPEHEPEVGTLQLAYSRVSAQEKATVSAKLRGVRDDERPSTRVDADYRYQETPGAGGELDFALDKDMDLNPGRPGIEHLTVRSRWTQTGSGRSDVEFSRGDLGSGSAQASECWDSNFLSRYFTASYGAPGYGEVSACAPFLTPDYSSL
jgi:hypothetical protein